MQRSPSPSDACNYPSLQKLAEAWRAKQTIVCGRYSNSPSLEFSIGVSSQKRLKPLPGKGSSSRLSGDPNACDCTFGRSSAYVRSSVGVFFSKRPQRAHENTIKRMAIAVRVIVLSQHRGFSILLARPQIRELIPLETSYHSSDLISFASGFSPSNKKTNFVRRPSKIQQSQTRLRISKRLTGDNL